MNINEKVDLLFNMQNLSNKQVADAISIDASLISRVRNNKRKLNKNSSTFEALVKYFSMNDNSVKLLIDNSYLNKDDTINKTSATIIKSWLLGEENLITYRNELHYNLHDSSDVFIYMQADSSSKETIINNFNSSLNKKKNTKNLTVYYYSDQTQLWNSFDYEKLFQKGQKSLQALLKNNAKLIYIYCRNKNKTERFLTLNFLLPLLLDNVILYYYPNIKDQISNRTQCIVKNTISFDSFSLLDNEPLSILTKNKELITAHLNEFKDYQALCEKLLFKPKQNADKNFDTYSKNFFEDHSSYINYSYYPSVITKNFDKEYQNLDTKKLISYQNKFFKALKTSMYYDIIYLNLEDESMYENPLYNKEDLLNHLKNIKKIANKYPNYIPLITNKLYLDYNLQVKRDDILILSKNAKKSIIKVSKVKFFVEDCYTFLYKYMNTFDYYDNYKADSLKKIDTIIKKLEK